MKRSVEERRAEALGRLRNNSFEHSRAKRQGSLTREEWQSKKDLEISRLEELLHVRKTS